MKGEYDMRFAKDTLKNVNSKWLEGLILLSIIIIAIFLAGATSNDCLTTIADEQVSMWSGSIDNLK